MRFADGPTEPHRVRVLRNLNNQIMTVVVGEHLIMGASLSGEKKGEKNKIKTNKKMQKNITI